MIDMFGEEWHAKERAFALNFIRRAMTAAGIEHRHIDDARLTEAIEQSRTPKVWVVDEQSATDMVSTSTSYGCMMYPERRHERRPIRQRT